MNEEQSNTPTITVRGSHSDVDFLHRLRAANAARDAIWNADGKVTLSFRGNELAGETGEACNVLKKLDRERMGMIGSRDTVEHLAQELADVVICADLVAMEFGIKLPQAIANKFNHSSDKAGIPVYLGAEGDSIPMPQDPDYAYKMILIASEYLKSQGMDPGPIAVSVETGKKMMEAMDAAEERRAAAGELPPVGSWAKCALDGQYHKIVAHDLESAEPMALTCGDSLGYWGAYGYHWSDVRSDQPETHHE